MRKISFLIFLIIILFPNVGIAEKTGGDHARIWFNAGVNAIGIGKIVKVGGTLVRLLKPETWEMIGKDANLLNKAISGQQSLQDPTGAGWLLWSATTAAEVGATILETAVPAVRIGNAALGVGYAYYRNYQDDWMKELKKKPKPPYRPKPLPPYIPKPKKPGNDHPDDYIGVLDEPIPTTPSDDLQMLLEEYDDFSLNYLAFEVGLSINDPVCDAQMTRFVQKLQTTNLDYDTHLQETEKLSEEAYQSAYEVQKKICLLYYGTITETTEFPHFKTPEEVTNFLNSLTSQQKEELLALQKIHFDKMKVAVEGEKKIYEDIRNTVDVGIMYYGFPDELVSLLNSLEVSNATFWDDEEDLSRYKTIILPSAGFFGMDSSEIFKWQLREYVKAGGVLISSAQQQGYEFSCLPGGEVKGYGWGEDQSCWTNAAYVDTYKPCFAGQDSGNLDVNVDGYFTQWPASATVLLRRTKNNMPCMLMYPYGKGWVIASTLYSDWGYGHNHTSNAELKLIRDLISWAKDLNNEIPEFKPEDGVKLDVKVTNNTDKYANKVILTLIDPDRNIIGSHTVFTSLPPHQTTQVNFTSSLIPHPPSLGIWWIDYELQDSAGNTIQPQTEGERFAISKHLVFELDWGWWLKLGNFRY